jgi:hypothetical protein
MVNTYEMTDNLLWFVHPSHYGSSKSFKSLENLATSTFGSSSTYELSHCNHHYTHITILLLSFITICMLLELKVELTIISNMVSYKT